MPTVHVPSTNNKKKIITFFRKIVTYQLSRFLLHTCQRDVIHKIPIRMVLSRTRTNENNILLQNQTFSINSGVIHVLIKLLISQLLVALYFQTWFKIDAKTQFLYQVVQYTNDIILLFMNAIWNIRNNRKNAEKLRGIHAKLLISQLLITLEKQTGYHIKLFDIGFDVLKSLEV